MPAPQDGPRPAMRAAWWQSPAVLAVAATAVTAVLLGLGSLVALAIALMEGSVAAATVGAAALAGGWLMPLFGLGDRPWRDRLVLGACLGVGSLSLIVLGLGSVGWLTRPVAGGLAIVLAVLALARLAADFLRAFRIVSITRAELRRSDTGDEDPAAGLTIGWFHWLWLLACPFLALALAAAALPPGILWAEEGFGYDVLEYHLAVPKAFLEAGRIGFLPYNVYSNFPQNAEMLSLLIMTLRGDAIDAAFMATMANVAVAGLFVAAAWWAGRAFSRRAGVVAGVLAATAPWLAYVAGIAYVEPGMLAMGMGSLGAILRVRDDREHAGRWALVAGLLGGLACGYKYTAGPLIALPIGLLVLFADVSWGRRLKAVAVYGLAGLAAFSPWLIRNSANTGNPVFPLAYRLFGAKEGTWDTDLDAHWREAHGHEDARASSAAPLVVTALQRTALDYRMGPAGLLLAVLGGLRRRDRWSLALVLLLIWQAAVWFTATHLFARFASVMLLPAIVLAARSVEELRRPAVTALIAALVSVGTAWNLVHLGALYYHHTHPGSPPQPINAYGRTDWFSEGSWPGMEYLTVLNALEPEHRVLLVGEARTFYLRVPVVYATVFNHHPLSEALDESADETAVLARLSDRDITHVLVHWGEILRLASTYGYDPRIGPPLFARLEAAGLRPMGSFFYEEGGPPYATLYEVPR